MWSLALLRYSGAGIKMTIWCQRHFTSFAVVLLVIPSSRDTTLGEELVIWRKGFPLRVGQSYFQMARVWSGSDRAERYNADTLLTSCWCNVDNQIDILLTHVDTPHAGMTVVWHGWGSLVTWRPSGCVVDRFPFSCGATKQKQSLGCTQFTVKVCNLPHHSTSADRTLSQ